MIEFSKTLRASARTATGTTKLYIFVDDAGILCSKDNTGTVTEIVGGGSGGGVAVPNLINATAGRAVASTDLGNVIVYDNAANGTFTIPDDATLTLSGVTANSFEVYQKNTGRADIAAGAGVTLNIWTGYPTSAQYVTQTAYRVGANTWAVK